MSVRCDGSIPSLGIKCPRHRRGNYKRGDDGTVGSIALCQERTWRASIEMRGSQSLMASRPLTAMSVAVSRAISFSCPPVFANTSAWANVRVRPAFTTRPRARMRSPAAGARRLILNSVVRTPVPAGMRVSAAYPAAVSAMTLTAPA
jgi:hypothetical protein